MYTCQAGSSLTRVALSARQSLAAGWTVIHLFLSDSDQSYLVELKKVDECEAKQAGNLTSQITEKLLTLELRCGRTLVSNLNISYDIFN